MNNSIRRFYILAVILAGLFHAALQAQPTLTNGLIAYYPFHGNANDLAGTNNGSVLGAVLTTNRLGIANSAYSFNGSNAFIQTIRPMPDLAYATFSIWFKANSVSNAPNVLFSDSTPAYGNDFVCEISPLGTNHGIYVSGTKNGGQNGATIANGTANFKQKMANTWLQLVWVMQPKSQELFINGVLVTNAAVLASNVGYHNNGFVIGADSAGSPYSKFFNGAISDLRIYNRALATNEVAALYQSDSGNPQIASATQVLQLSTKNLVVGKSYQIQSSADFVNWTNVGNSFVATSTNTPIIVSMNGPQAYFRLLATP